MHIIVAFGMAGAWVTALVVLAWYVILGSV